MPASEREKSAMGRTMRVLAAVAAVAVVLAAASYAYARGSQDTASPVVVLPDVADVPLLSATSAGEMPTGTEMREVADETETGIEIVPTSKVDEQQAVVTATLASTTTATTRPPRPVCDQAGYKSHWHNPTRRWSECQMPPIPARCKGAGRTAEWNGGWDCKTHPKPVCDAKGWITTWSRVSETWSECGRPDAQCPKDYPLPHWKVAEGRWGCWRECDSGYESYFTSNDMHRCYRPCAQESDRYYAADGEPKCLATCDFGLTRIILKDNEVRCYPQCKTEGEWREIQADGRYVCWPADVCLNGKQLERVAGRGQVCLPTDAMEDVFWGVAFSRAGIAGQISGKWIGGFVANYGEPVFFDTDYWDYHINETGLASADDRELAWAVNDRRSFSANINGLMVGAAHAHVCYGHDCFRESLCPDGCGLVGSTDPSHSGCRVYIWDDESGVWFLMNVDASNVCQDAYARIVAKDLRGASMGTLSTAREVVGSKQYGGVEYPIYMWSPETIDEITLTPYGVDRRTWLTAKDFD